MLSVEFRAFENPLPIMIRGPETSHHHIVIVLPTCSGSVAMSSRIMIAVIINNQAQSACRKPSLSLLLFWLTLLAFFVLRQLRNPILAIDSARQLRHVVQVQYYTVSNEDGQWE